MANIDGYEKQSRYASNGQDLNRDHTKLTNQETIAIKQSISDFSPDLMVDFHEYKPYDRFCKFWRVWNYLIIRLYVFIFW